MNKAKRILQGFKSSAEVVPELPKGGLDVFPLEAPYVANKPLPLSADTPESMERLQRLVKDDPEAAKEFALEAGAKKERQLEDYFSKKQSGKREDTLTDVIPPQAGLVERTVDKLGLPQRKALKYIADKLKAEGASDTNSEKSSQAIVSKVAEQLGIPEDSVPGNVAKAVGVGALEMFADPLNVVPVGKVAKMAGKVLKPSGPLGQGREIAQASIEKLLRDRKRQQAMEVLAKARSPEASTAQKMAAQGAEVIVPRNIIKSRP